MINSKKIIGIILARGGSKRLPGKNIKDFCGKPLIEWSIEAAKRSKHIDDVVMSTDLEDIGKVAQEFGVEYIKRPDALASDTATSEDALIYVLKTLTKKYDYFIYLQPTSPLRTTQHIDEALEIFEKSPFAETLISVTKVDKNPYWIQKINKKGFIENYFCSSNKFLIPKDNLYFPNGAIFIGKENEFLRSKKLYTSRTIPYIMDKKFSVDIDDEGDLHFAEYLFQQSI